MVFKPETKEELKDAVNLWCDDEEEATNKYGDINTWDVSLITDMSDLFKNKEKFNSDISCWNTQHVTNMKGMFFGCKLFNQPLNNWNTQNVTNMHHMLS